MLQFNTENISKYRTQLMGVATLLVIFGHSIGNGVIMPKWMEFLCGLASIGVDIFLLVSGLGLWFSLRNNEVKYAYTFNMLIQWYSKRYKRILLPYFIIMGTHYIISVIFGTPISQALLGFSTISYWTNHQGAWFIAMLIPVYAITPLHYYICKKIKNTALFTLILICFIVIISSINYPLTDIKLQMFIDNIKHILYHLPVFFIGFMMAPLAKEKRNISILWISIVPLIIVFLMKYFQFGYWPGFLVFPFILICCWLFRYCGNITSSFFSFFGKISLESYLFNGIIGAWIIWFFPSIYESSLNKGCYLHYTLICIIGTTLAYFVNKLCNKILSR